LNKRVPRGEGTLSLTAIKMSRSWASVARGSAPAPALVPATAPEGGWEGAEWQGFLAEQRKQTDKVKKVWAEMDLKYGLARAPASALRPEAPAWTPGPRCYYCGSAADVCPECVKTMSYYPGWGHQAVVGKGRCSQHGGYTLPHAFFNKKMNEFIPQTCSGCRAEHPWSHKNHLEVTGFSYERSCLTQPLKSPNGGAYNVVYVNKRRYIRLGQAKSSPEQVAAWAQEAYDVEMAFSGETRRADAVRRCILENDLNGVYLH
jgi:hypothetical protein